MLRNEVNEVISSQLLKARLDKSKIYLISAWDMAKNKCTMDEHSFFQDIISTAYYGRTTERKVYTNNKQMVQYTAPI